MKRVFVCALIVLSVVAVGACSGPKDQGTPKSGQEQPLPTAAQPKKIVILELTESGLSETFKKRMGADLAENGLAEKRDYVSEIKSAQGDNAALISLIDAAKNSKPDLLITFQPQTLFAAIKRAPELNKVFGILTDPFVLGGGKSNTDHLPHLTGYYMELAYDQLAAFLNELSPKPKRLGMIYLMGEDNSVKRMENMSKALKRYGIQLAAQGYTTQSEISSAANALFTQKLDGVVRFPDSSETLAVASLKPLSQREKIPLYSFGADKDGIQTSLAVRNDYNQVSKSFWKIVARALKGEALAQIPFESSKDLKVSFHIDQKEFAACKIKIPEASFRDSIVLQ